ncbi:nucleotidyltransferase family protein [Photorhabdus temperata]|uniref:Putative nucleotidyltransferase n=1 Tax=Photorhabdus temperata subsp. temperata Meg1 TaxID=1393735 RepID=A0A081RZK1_PHOTE|nr:nucleotidyltransferase family protein [Photorhabdus temperata]KER04104.1 putative nucleotidyltransferase [Photorhabdus temperata subsp. temperata Meg1]MCT8349352.1 nucleotidyltransferase family protein [Photorhabdus temperata]
MRDNDYFLKALVDFSRVTGFESVKNRIIKNINHPSFNWDLFLAICFKNKVAGLVYNNIVSGNIQNEVPCRVYYTLRYFYYCNKKRNIILISELDKIIDSFEENQIDVRPLKGAVLIPTIYKDIGSRMMNDIDLFVNKSDIKQLPEIMHQLGFTQGNFDKRNLKVQPLPFNENAIWKLKMFNLPPFHKPIKEHIVDVVSVDFTFGISFTQSKDVSSLLMANSAYYVNYKSLGYIDLFIHICCHLYKEASNSAWEKFKQNINLIKFCDVRESYYIFVTHDRWKELISQILELDVSNSVYFALKNTADLYNDSELFELSKRIPNVDISSQDYIYNQDENVVHKRNKSIIDCILEV